LIRYFVCTTTQQRQRTSDVSFRDRWVNRTILLLYNHIVCRLSSSSSIIIIIIIIIINPDRVVRRRRRHTPWSRCSRRQCADTASSSYCAKYYAISCDHVLFRNIRFAICFRNAVDNVASWRRCVAGVGQCLHPICTLINIIPTTPTAMCSMSCELRLLIQLLVGPYSLLALDSSSSNRVIFSSTCYLFDYCRF
jgi:hypothetical protein